MRDIQVRAHPRSAVDIFGDEHKWKLTAFSKHLDNLSIGQMLQNLADQAQIAMGEFILNGIRALELYATSSKSGLVIGN
jgi:hypothetical protein